MPFYTENEVDKMHSDFDALRRKVAELESLLAIYGNHREDETMSNHDPRTSTRTDGLYFPHFPADNMRYSLRFYSAKMDHMFHNGGIPLWMHRAECRAEGCRGHYSN